MFVYGALLQKHTSWWSKALLCSCRTLLMESPLCGSSVRDSGIKVEPGSGKDARNISASIVVVLTPMVWSDEMISGTRKYKSWTLGHLHICNSRGNLGEADL